MACSDYSVAALVGAAGVNCSKRSVAECGIRRYCSVWVLAEARRLRRVHYCEQPGCSRPEVEVGGWAAVSD